jgi:hypothetical protein
VWATTGAGGQALANEILNYDGIIMKAWKKHMKNF